MVSENLEQVKANIEAACKRVGRDPKDVRLVAVSKTKPISLIEGGNRSWSGYLRGKQGSGNV